jgi:predicted dithiol-disulfide oxidoreductase (DUF899 family)/uncharacterized protein YndB with AHSA1/START domain
MKTMPLPKVATREEWLAARKALLRREKELTRQRDAVNADRRRLPMVRIEKGYEFQGPTGTLRLRDLFDGRRQLIVYHFMFDPDWEQGCPSCSLLVDNIGHLSHLHARDTALVLVSRAPLEKILPFKARMGWTVPWVSAFGSDFNYDFHVTMDESVAPVEYNYRSKVELLARGEDYFAEGESHGVSAFLREGDAVFHTYSAYARGAELLLGTYNWLDLTALGRQEDWEEPAGRSDGPFMHWVRHHDRYEGVPAGQGCCAHATDAPREDHAMTPKVPLKVSCPSEVEVTVTRVFDAPRRSVFEAMTRPELVKRWLYGPEDWPLVQCEIDPKPGGRLRYVWRNKEKGDMGMSGVFRAVEAPQRIVHTELFDEDWTGGETLVTTILEERGGRAEASSTVRYSSKEARDGALKTGMIEGWGVAYDRLAELLDSGEARARARS